MKASTRIETLLGGGSDGWEVFLLARRMIAQGEKVTELTIGEHDIRTHPSILAAMDRAARGGHTGYASVPGTDSLRRAVAARIEARTGVPTTAANVLITTGGQAALFAAHLGTCDAGDTAAYIDPYYATYPGTIRGAGAVPRAIPTRPEDAFQPTRAALEDGCRGATSLLINTPNNPTGVVYDDRTLAAIAEVVTANDIWLISDEVYDTQVWDGRHLSPRALPGMAARTLVIGSMSKSHAMTGSRVGWICGPEAIVAHLASLAIHTTYGVPGFIQDAAEFALNEGAPLEDEVAAPFARRRRLTLEALAGQNTVTALPAQGAMYVMLDIRATGLSGDGFAKALLAEEKIAVMPGESFGQAAAGHVRVAMTVEDAAYVDALARMIRFAERRAEGQSRAAH